MQMWNSMLTFWRYEVKLLQASFSPLRKRNILCTLILVQVRIWQDGFIKLEVIYFVSLRTKSIFPRFTDTVIKVKSKQNFGQSKTKSQSTAEIPTKKIINLK